VAAGAVRPSWLSGKPEIGGGGPRLGPQSNGARGAALLRPPPGGAIGGWRGRGCMAAAEEAAEAQVSPLVVSKYLVILKEKKQCVLISFFSPAYGAGINTPTGGRFFCSSLRFCLRKNRGC
jgi:hypothetical protein